MQKQKTLATSFSMQGKGLHTGLDIQITFHPAPENHGYKIKRVDLEGEPVIDAVAENVAGTQRGTVLSKNGIQVSTIEHAMAALYAYEIDNCLIEVNAPEFPILDGSSRFFSEEIQKAGVVEQNAPKDYYIVKHKIEVKDEETGSSLIILPDDKFSVNVLISFNSSVLSNQFATLNDLSEFPTELAASRTFVFVREVEMLLQNNLIKGGDLDNAIVIYDQKVSQEVLDNLADKLSIPHKDVQDLGYINNKPLVFDNEPARHKLIDVIGDLALIGKPIRGRVIATRPGHKINNQLARMIRKDIKLNEVQAPVYDPNSTPVMDINRIRELLPHRYPFLLVDKIIEIGGNYIVGDCSKLPHMLIAGTTGSGKSVCINSLLISMLYKSTPEELRLIMVDPKMVELGGYNGIPHLLIPVVTDPKKAAGALQWAVTEMMKRYRLFAEAGVRELSSYNQWAKGQEGVDTMPKVVIVIDVHLPGGSDGPCRRHAPGHCHPAPLGGRHHRPDEGQHPLPDRLRGGLLPGVSDHPGQHRGGKAGGQGGYALVSPGFRQASAGPGLLHL